MPRARVNAIDKSLSNGDLDDLWQSYSHFARSEPRANTAPDLRPDGASIDTIARELGCSPVAAASVLRRGLRKCAAWCAEHGYRLEDLLLK